MNDYDTPFETLMCFDMVNPKKHMFVFVLHRSIYRNRVVPQCMLSVFGLMGIMIDDKSKPFIFNCPVLFFN